MLRNPELALLKYPLILPVSSKRNMAFWEISALWVLLSLCLVAEGKSDANFSFDNFLCMRTFSEISISNNYSIAISQPNGLNHPNCPYTNHCSYMYFHNGFK